MTDPVERFEQVENGPFITTYSGAKFYIDDVNIEDIPVEDIAHALSMNCRFNGHLEEFYSVAEHSVIVSRLVSPENALWGLIHDIGEAFVPDIPRPFKSVMNGFEEYENRILEATCNAIFLPVEMPEEVKHIDTHMPAAEAKKFMKQPPEWIKYYDTDICPEEMLMGYSPWQAKMAWMARYYELTEEVYAG